MGGRTKTTQTSNSTSKAAPPEWTLPGLQMAGQRVTDALKAGPPAAYTGDFVATPNYADPMAAYRAAAGAAGGYAGRVDDIMSNWAPTQATFSQSNLPTFQAWANPNTDATMDAAIRGKAAGVTNELLTQVLPTLRSSALDAGAYSGDRASTILPQLALADANKNISDIAAQYVYENAQANANRDLSAWQAGNQFNLDAYGLDTQRGLGTAELLANQNLNYLNQLPALVDTAMRMRTSEGDILSQVAELDRASRQAGIDNAIAQHDYQVRQPYEGLDFAAALLQQLGQGYGTQTSQGTQTTTQQTSGLGPIMQGLMGAAGMALSFPTGGGSTLASSLFGAKAAQPAAAAFAPSRYVFPQ